VSRSAGENQCPDCNGELVAIKLFGRNQHPLGGRVIDAEVIYYAEADAERSFFLGMFKEVGIISASMCNGCRRIFLHGVPKRSSALAGMSPDDLAEPNALDVTVNVTPFLPDDRTVERLGDTP
jgi:hypothetical protein